MQFVWLDEIAGGEAHGVKYKGLAVHADSGASADFRVLPEAAGVLAIRDDWRRDNRQTISRQSFGRAVLALQELGQLAKIGG